MNDIALAAQIIRNAADAVVVADASGKIVVWNDAATRVFGYTATEAIGQSLDIITPERLRSRHWEGYHKSMATGTTKYGNDLLKVPAVHKDGRAMSIAFTVAMLHDEAGKVSAILSIIRDETARFAEERALKARVTALEAQMKSSAP